MKIRIISLALLLLSCVFSTTFALKLTSQAITQFNISQLSYSEESPFKIKGKIWGDAPEGEINRMLYKLENPQGNILWEFVEPYEREFAPGEPISEEFEFDFSDVLIDGESVLRIELQTSSMNGSFSQTKATGFLNLIFPERVRKEIKVSEITQFSSEVLEGIVYNKIDFRNNREAGLFTAKITLIDSAGVEKIVRNTEEFTVESYNDHKFELHFPSPEEPGVYEVRAQIFSGKDAVTGMEKREIVTIGDIGVLSELRITPKEFLYAGNKAMIEFVGAVSNINEPTAVNLLVQDRADKEVFTLSQEVEIDETGKFTGAASFVVPDETAELIVTANIIQAEKLVGTSQYKTGIQKKVAASIGQSEISFQAEQVKQEFETGDLQRKIGMILILVVILVLAGLFIWIVLRTRGVKQLIIPLLLMGLFSMANAEVTFTQPVDGWTVAPQSSTLGFRQLHFMGTVEVGPSGIFPIGSDITVYTRFFPEGSSVADATHTFSFITSVNSEYEYVIEVPNTLSDGAYSVQIEFEWSGLTEELIVDLDDLIISVDNTSPQPELTYYKMDGTQYQELLEGEYTNQPVRVASSCEDETGCFAGINNPFIVTGNFCTGESYCEEDAIDDYLVCDQVGNCSQPLQAEIKHYDPVAPTATGVQLSDKTGGTMKAMQEYVLSLIGLGDAEIEELTIDDSACGGDDSPFFKDETNTICREKYAMCAISASSRGIIDQRLTGQSCAAECPPGMDLTEWNTCDPCSQVSFPMCFDLQLQ